MIGLVVSVARSNANDVETPLAIVFSFIQSSSHSFSYEDI